jgi:apolipoprotein N-acyltransferase
MIPIIRKWNKYSQRKKLLLLGLATFFATPPIFIFPILFLSFSYFLYNISMQKRFVSMFRNSLYFTWGYFFTITYWFNLSTLHDLKYIIVMPFGMILIPLIYAIIFSTVICFALYFAKRITHDGILLSIIFSTSWVACEYFRSNHFIPFPWWQFGMNISFSNDLMQLIKYSDIYIITFLLMIICTSPFVVINKKSNMKRVYRILYIMLIGVAFLVAIFYGKSQIGNDDENLDLQITGIQNSISTNEKWGNKEKSIIDIQDVVNPKNLESKIIIWPEGAIPHYFDLSSDKRDKTSAKILHSLKGYIDSSQVLISGGFRYNDGEYYNTMFFITKNGIDAYYDKTKLAPFGEYIPFYEYLQDFIPRDMSHLFASMSAGRKVGKVIKVHDYNIMPIICYEVVFDIKPRKKPDIIVNISDDNWFNYTTGPYQHLYHAKMFAIKQGVPMIRVVNNGVTAVIDKHGRVIKKIDRWQTGYLEHNF